MSEQLKRILYLEDQDLIATLAVMALEDFGNFDVRHCETGQDAIDAVSEFDPQLLLFDVMLPDMDGPETFARIRKMSGFETIPVIFMTAKAQIHQQTTYHELGACGVILKPFEPLELGDQITEMWRNAVQSGADGESQEALQSRASGHSG